MKVAIVSDIHGKILLPFKMVDAYQKETGNKIDFILHCGDLGTYPNMDNLDKATRKYSQINRDELGFYDYFTKVDPEIKAFLDELDLTMISIRGNHEDHDYLDDLEKQYARDGRFPIDVYGRVFMCKTGWKQELATANEVLSFVGIGRIGDRKGRTTGRFIQDYERAELKKLIKTNEMFDVLITHDKDDGSERGYGMAEIAEVLDNIIFTYHFHGHTGEPFSEQTALNGITQTVKVHEMEFDDDGYLGMGCMLILTKENGTLRYEIVDQKLIDSFTQRNWKSR